MTTQSSELIIRGALVFDGVNEQLVEGKDVHIVDGKIASFDANPAVDASVPVIDASGRTLMPGLIDAHYHSMFNFWPISRVMNADFGLLSIAAAKAAGETLLRGFTTVRDTGGNSFPVAQATDAGWIDGPRVYPSGAMISQSGGHGDFRGPHVVPSNATDPLDYLQQVGHFLLADGVPEVMKRTREVLRMGATQIKAMAGGGVASLYDPLDVTEYTFEEMKAIVDVAKSWNTYVAVHVNTDAAIRQWLDAGALSLEHGFFMEDGTAKLVAERGAWWSMQPIMNDEDAMTFEDPISTAKFEKLVTGLNDAVTAARKYKVKTAFGCDMLFDPSQTSKQGKYLAKLQRWYTPYEALKMATADNAELLKMCGPRNPYPGDLGVVKEGAHADLILVDGNPLEDLDLVADPEKNFSMIMKAGIVYKNTIGNGQDAAR